jgi:hypothetical protein
MHTFTLYGMRDGEIAACEPIEAATPAEARQHAEARLPDFDLVVVCSAFGVIVRVNPCR